MILASPNKCSECLFAKEIRDDKTEAESLKRESMKLRDETKGEGIGLICLDSQAVHGGRGRILGIRFVTLLRFC